METLFKLISTAVSFGVGTYDCDFDWEGFLTKLGFDYVLIDVDGSLLDSDDFALDSWQPEGPDGYVLAWKYESEDCNCGAWFVRPKTPAARMLLELKAEEPVATK